MHRPASLLLAAGLLAASPAPAAHAADHAPTICLDGADTLRIAPAAPATSLTLDPTHEPATGPCLADGDTALTSAALRVTRDARRGTLAVRDAGGRLLLSLDLPAPGARKLRLRHDPAATLYGIAGFDKDADASAGLVRRGHWRAEAGAQGHAGAPFVWSTAGWGVLVASDGADFHLASGRITVDHLAQRDPVLLVFAGPPAGIFAALARASGAPPLFPKWASGFINSQWGIDEAAFRAIVAGYRARRIPLDAFTFDFDWKAWGADDYGEFRWNAVKFPGGPDGSLKRDMDRLGVHMTGIMKPRIHLGTVQGREADALGLWLKAAPATPDYFSGKPVRDVDFDLAATRRWFFRPALAASFDTGIVGWWNDEADTAPGNTQFLNMQRALYTGQRAHSPLRVWSINRAFWLGAQRYAYGLWSGDIATGFASMAAQRVRMLAAVNVGAMQWGMDGGGFRLGTPDPENYARWIQFGAFTPIFRVHGEEGQKRQPWVYGPVAEAAASAAIRLRYRLLPYIYSYQHALTARGIGLVRPLAFDWPDDPALANDTTSWLFGDWLLASPVVERGAREKRVRLPAGRWIEWANGTPHAGGQVVALALDTRGWRDIPLFIREGAIIPLRNDAPQYAAEKPLAEVEVALFPAAHATAFDYVDDDGTTYAYEHGAVFRQRLGQQRDADGTWFTADAPQGSFRPALTHYLLAFHGPAPAQVERDGRALPRYADRATLEHADQAAWASGTDTWGAVTWVRIPAGVATRLRLRGTEAAP